MAKRSTKSIRRERSWLTPEVLTISIVLPTLLLVLGAVLTWWLNRPSTKLEVVALVVEEGQYLADEGTFKPPAIQLSVRNIGQQVSVVTGVRLQVLDYAYLPFCQSGGGELLVSGTYDLLLPEDPEVNHAAFVDVAQSIEPNGADRFQVRVQAPLDMVPEGTYRYRLRVSLLRDGESDPLEAGVAVIESPLLRQDVDIFPADDMALSASDAECWRNLARDYERSEEWEGVKVSTSLSD